jgi:hypothetical protein
MLLFKAGFVVGVDRPADLGHPQLDAVVGEQGQGEPELVAVERPVGFADDHGVEAALWVAQRGQEPAGFGSALPRSGAALPNVEEPRDDVMPARGDQRLGERELPVDWGFWVLVVLGGDPSVERERQPGCSRLGRRRCLLGGHVSSPSGRAVSARVRCTASSRRRRARAASGLNSGGSGGMITRRTEPGSFRISAVSY